MKRLFLLILVVASACGVWAYDAEVEGIYYNLNDETMTATVTWGGAGYEGDVTIPSEIIVEGKSYAVKSIGGSAFYYCAGLTSVSIPESVESIEYTAFFCCSGLNAITIPEGVTTIGRHAFARCTRLRTLTIPASVTTIGEYAFQGCSALLKVTLPNTLTEIDEAAFYECGKLKEVVIPKSVQSIGRHAFGACGALESLSVEEGSEWFVSEGNCIIDNSNTLVVGCKTSVIPDYVTTIGNEAFYFATGLEAITIPDGVETIEESAFEGCEGLKEVTIGSGVNIIGNRAFESCSALTEVTIPDAVTRIGNSAFWRCAALAKVTIGKGVEYIDYYAFTGCKALREMVCNPEVMIECNEDTFYDFDTSKGTLFVPKALVEEYRNTEPWSGWGKISAIVDPAGIELPSSDKPEEMMIYSIDGRRLQKMQKGINIVRVHISHENRTKNIIFTK